MGDRHSTDAGVNGGQQECDFDGFLANDGTQGEGCSGGGGEGWR